MVSPNEVEKTWVQTDYITLHYILAAIINPMIFGFMKNKIGLVNDRSM